MNSNRNYLDYLEDIIAETNKIGQFIEGMTYEHFEKDSKTAYAVIRAWR